jgi:hypothetical protein
VLGPRGGVITTATLRDATGWDALVTELGQAGLVRHRLRHTALTWMADAGIDLHPAVGRRPSGSGSHGSLPASRCASHAGRWNRVCLVVRCWSGEAAARRHRGR